MNDELKAYFSAMGRKGGQNTVKKHGTKHFSEAGRKGALKRWSKGKGTETA